jgi:hypothetical protein
MSIDINGGYSFSRSGSWPFEQYTFTFLEFNNSKVNNIPFSRVAKNDFRYLNNISSDTNPSLFDYQLPLVNYTNCSFGKNNSGYYTLSSDSSNSPSSVTWTPSSLRIYGTGPTFNYFSIQNVNSQSLYSSFNPNDPYSYNGIQDYSYLLFPSTLILRPLTITANGNGTFTLTTEVKLLSSFDYYYYSRSSENLSYLKALEFRNTAKITFEGSLPATGTILYNISAVKMVKDNKIINFTNTYNPYFYQSVLDEFKGKSNVKIRPDSTYITYNTTYYDTHTEQSIKIGQPLSEIYPSITKSFNSSFILNQNIKSSTVQTFQMLQSSINLSKKIESLDNTIQSLKLNLTSGSVSYSAFPVLGLSGTANSFLGLTYISESDSFFVNQTNVDTYGNTSTSPIGTTTKTWTLQYPPHNYSLKATYKDASNQTHETATLNFYLSSRILNKYLSKSQIILSNNNLTQTSVSSYSAFKIDTNLVSDYNYMVLPLSTYALSDLISFKCWNLDSSYVNSLLVYYGPNLNQIYDIVNSPYIPAVSAQQLYITYPNELYGHIDLNLKASLSTTCTTIDSKDLLHIVFSENKTHQIVGYPIQLQTLSEKENQIILSCASLSSLDILPCKDLTDSYIRWSFTNSNLPLSLVSVDYDTYEPQLTTVNNKSIPYIIPYNTIVPFNSLTNTVLVSGYGNIALNIQLESFKYDQQATVSTNPIYFDIFKNSQFSILNSDFKNFNKTTVFSVSSKLTYEDSIFDIPSNTPLYWTWEYINKTLSQKITAFKTNGTVYNFGQVLPASDISSLIFNIDLDDGNNAFDTNIFKLKLNSNYRDRLIVGKLDLYLNDYPNKDIFNVDFTTVYSSYTSMQIADTFNNINVITRPKEDKNNFQFISNSSILDTLSSTSINWIISSDYDSVSTVNYFNNKNPQFTPNLLSRKTTVTLSASQATIPGWYIPNNISSTVTIYTIPSSEFYSPLNFILFPPYTWQPKCSGFLTLLNYNNYTLAYAPTAYGNKKSNSQNFYVSASRNFSLYEYSYSDFSSIITTLTSFSGSIDIPYHPEIYSNIGSKISLKVYDEKYPSINGVTYKGVDSTNTPYYGQFSTYTQTIPFSSVYLNTISSFKQSPKVVPYDTLLLTFSSLASTINLDNNIFVSVYQSTYPYNSSTSPVRLVDGFFNGTVVYDISTKNWETNIEVSQFDGIYDLGILKVGDSSIPFTITDYEITNLTLKVSSSCLTKIPPTTFQNVTGVYTGDMDLWLPVNQSLNVSDPITITAYSTSVNPKIFISSYYSTTANSIYFQFETPENTYNYKITAYDVFFGDSLSARIYDDQIYYKTYLTEGIYQISYTVYYNDGTSNFFYMPGEITIYREWPHYDQNKIRLLNEITLEFGNELEDTFNLDQIKIQPNEWGDSDIFNTAIKRLQLNLDYLKYNSQTINTDSPSLFYGWLGTNKNYKSKGITWYTQTYNKDDVNLIQNSTSLESEIIKDKFSYFNKIIDAVEVGNKLFVIDDNKFRMFVSGKTPTEIFFQNINEINSLLVTPTSIYASEDGTEVYISDSFKNKIYKFNVNIISYPAEINLQLSVGNLGDKLDTNKFNSPSELAYQNETVFVLDYNNKCVKQFTKDLNWMYTYYSEDFETDQPIVISVHPDSLIVYVFTKRYKLYIFDYFNTDVFHKIDLSSINDGNSIIKMFFDESGDFIYFLSKKNIFKCSAIGTYISQTIIQNDQNIIYNSGKASDYRSVILITDNSILKFQDVLNIFKIGEGLSYKYWTEDQLLLSIDEFADDLSYNRSLNRITQNIKSFRDTLESRFVIVTEQTDAGTIKYFSLFPVSHENRPIFSDKIENETLGVGVNEFHIPSVFNRELEEIYNALLILKDFLNIKDVRVLNNKVENIDNGCSGSFCWSWKAMSCYNLSLPVIKICNINPITYSELKADFPEEYSYVLGGENRYGYAKSDCCSSTEQQKLLLKYGITQAQLNLNINQIFSQPKLTKYTWKDPLTNIVGTILPVWATSDEKPIAARPPIIQYRSTTKPSTPIYVYLANDNSGVGSYQPVNNASITIDYNNVYDDLSNSLNIYYTESINDGVWTLHSTVFTKTGTTTIRSLRGGQLYYIKAINDKNEQSNILSILIPNYLS